MRYQRMFFDFDITPADPGSGIPNGAASPCLPRPGGRKRNSSACVEPPLPVTFGEIFVPDQEEPNRTVAARGIPAILANLNDAGCELPLAICKMKSVVGSMPAILG